MSDVDLIRRQKEAILRAKVILWPPVCCHSAWCMVDLHKRTEPQQSCSSPGIRAAMAGILFRLPRIPDAILQSNPISLWIHRMADWSYIGHQATDCCPVWPCMGGRSGFLCKPPSHSRRMLGLLFSGTFPSDKYIMSHGGSKVV